MLGMIFARSLNRVIGYKGAIPWHVPADFIHFKKVTTGKVVIMGRATWESLPDGFRPLPNRTNVVISTTMESIPDHCDVHSTLESALQKYSDQECWIIGGQKLFDACRHIVTDIWETVIHKDYEGDTFSPQLDLTNWNKECYLEITTMDNTLVSFTRWVK